MILSITSGMAVFLLLHVFIWRLHPSNSPRILLLWALGGIGVLVSLLLGRQFGGMDLYGYWAILSIDFFVIILYTFFYAGISRSVSVTLMARFLKNSNQPLPLDDLVQDYKNSSRFEDRIILMERMGTVQNLKGRIRLTQKGRRIALLLKSLSRFFGLVLEG